MLAFHYAVASSCSALSNITFKVVNGLAHFVRLTQKRGQIYKVIFGELTFLAWLSTPVSQATSRYFSLVPLASMGNLQRFDLHKGRTDCLLIDARQKVFKRVQSLREEC